MTLAALLGAVGQLIMKLVGQDLAVRGLTVGSMVWLLVVFLLYGGVMGLFMIGLKHGKELSTTYPVYSLTFVWAAILGFLFLDERLLVIQITGIAVICGGVALINMPALGRTKEREGS
jgi:drug/metabolite transporter (DMT)-like permease